MSTIVSNNLQIGQSGTATNNFTLYQPLVADGTVRLANGNTGSTTDLVTVTSAGRVGIGTNNPSWPLVVQGNGDVNIRAISATTNGSGQIGVVGNGAGSYPGFNLYQDSTHYWSVQQRADTDLHIYRQSGTGNVVIDNSTLVLPQGQIKFPATQNASSDANTLDDYEEGTWTPVDGSGAGITMGNNFVATYTKIGRVVTVSAWPTWASNTSGVNARIGGLPFPVDANAYHSGCVGYSPFSNEMLVLGDPGTSYVSVRYYSGGYRTNQYLSGSGFIFSMTYYTAS